MFPQGLGLLYYYPLIMVYEHIQIESQCINALHAGLVSMLLSFADFFFKSITFGENNSGTISECQMVWIQTRTVLIWVLSVSKGYQQTTKVAASKERVNGSIVYEWYHLN